MKRVTSKASIIPAERAPSKSMRLCTRSECDKVLTRTQKKFCSHACRNMVLSPGNTGGRPSSYKPEYATSKLEEYLTLCSQGSEPTLIPTQSSYIVRENARLPSLEGYAELLGVSDDTLRNWTAQQQPFALAMDRLRSIQREFLINNGLSGRSNPTIVKLLLGANHGIFERREIDKRSTHQFIGIVRHIYERADEIEQERYGSR